MTEGSCEYAVILSNTEYKAVIQNLYYQLAT